MIGFMLDFLAGLKLVLNLESFENEFSIWYIYRPLKRTELSDRTIYIRGQLYNDFVRQDKVYRPLKRTELSDRTIYIQGQLY